jgi:hypothetical protein
MTNQKPFAGSVSAIKTETVDFKVNIISRGESVSILAINQMEALGILQLYTDKRFPGSDGWNVGTSVCDFENPLTAKKVVSLNWARYDLSKEE